MAQTTRKRRNKHRGNAAGRVEARGRTSKPRDDQRSNGRSGVAARAARPIKPPTFQAALIKAAIGGLVLFALMRFGIIGKQASTRNALELALLAVVFYSPIMFLTDKWAYKRKTGQIAARSKR